MKNISIKLMLLGITVMLAGIYVHLEPGLSQNLNGREFFIVLIGFIVSVVSFIADLFPKDTCN